jgi:ABC-type ATPase involved in cell division
MAINLTSTKTVQTDGIKILCYGQSGAGKTSLIPTLPNPVILSAEAGLLSISGHDIPFIEVKDMATLREAYAWAKTCEFETICLDSISEIAEVCLATEKKRQQRPPRCLR